MTNYYITEGSAMKKPSADFVLVLDDLKKEGKLKISPISREANSFECPKCGSLISPENPESYSEFGNEENAFALVQCKRCNAKLAFRECPSRGFRIRREFSFEGDVSQLHRQSL